MRNTEMRLDIAGFDDDGSHLSIIIHTSTMMTAHISQGYLEGHLDAHTLISQDLHPFSRSNTDLHYLENDWPVQYVG